MRSSLAVAHAPRLAERLAPLEDEAAALWHSTPATLPRLGPSRSWLERWSTARAARQLVDDLARRIETYPEEASQRDAWRQATCERLRGFGEARLGWPEGYRRLLLGDAFYRAAASFAREARAFDAALQLNDLWQALRNVWIANSLQMLLGRPVALTPGLFAYSMLYPVTDNVLDAPDLPAADKRLFNERFGRRLEGEALRHAGAHESRAFELVRIIEGEFARISHPDVWDSVLAIHRAQVASLRQQQATALTHDELLARTVAKGGASVLADLYLVAGVITPDDERFAFGYGVFLQVLDDLQDVTADLAAGHQTLVTHAAERGPLDEVAARLARYMDVVLDRCPRRAHVAAWPDCVDLIRRNCRSLLVGVVAAEPGRFTRAFRRSIEREWPLGLRAMKRLRRRAIRRLSAAARHGDDGRPLVDRLVE